MYSIAFTFYVGNIYICYERIVSVLPSEIIRRNGLKVNKKQIIGYYDCIVEYAHYKVEAYQQRGFGNFQHAVKPKRKTKCIRNSSAFDVLTQNLVGFPSLDEVRVFLLLYFFTKLIF